MKQNPKKDSLDILSGKHYVADEHGRIVIDDPEMIEMIKGSLGQATSELNDAFWNGACSNQRCFD